MAAVQGVQLHHALAQLQPQELELQRLVVAAEIGHGGQENTTQERDVRESTRRRAKHRRAWGALLREPKTQNPGG